MEQRGGDEKIVAHGGKVLRRCKRGSAPSASEGEIREKKCERRERKKKTVRGGS